MIFTGRKGLRCAPPLTPVRPKTDRFRPGSKRQADSARAGLIGFGFPVVLENVLSLVPEKGYILVESLDLSSTLKNRLVKI